MKVGERNRALCPTPSKEAYRSRKVARIRARNTPHQPGERIGAYRCGCGAWHVGKLRGSREQAREMAAGKMAQKKGGPREGRP